MNSESNTPKTRTESNLFFLLWIDTVILDIHGRPFNMKDVVENVTPTFNDTYEIVWKNGKTQTIRIVGRIAQSLIGTDLWGPCFTIVGLCYPST